MLSSMVCPNCHAPLEYDPEVHHVTIKCDYCHSTIMVPESLREASQEKQAAGSPEMWAEIMGHMHHGRKIEAIKAVREHTNLNLEEAKELIDALEASGGVFVGDRRIVVDVSSMTTGTQRKAGRWVGCLVAAIVAVIIITAVIPLVGGGLAAWFGLSQIDTLSGSSATPGANRGFALPGDEDSEGDTAPTQTPAFAEVVLTIGGKEGVGPGFFNDTRWIGQDAGGNYYAADYSDGRVQVFDSAGNFVALWNSGIDYAGGFTVGLDGTVYIIEARDTLRFNGLTGEPLPPVNLPFEVDAESLATGPDGSIYIYSPDRLVRLSPQGEVLLDLPGLSATFANLDGTYPGIAPDGAGNLFLLGDNIILEINAEGRLVKSFGNEGDGPDQFFTDPTAVSVDGQGRVYVSSWVNILVFDPSGRYIDTIELNGVTFDMFVTPRNELAVMDRNNNRLVVYRLP